MDLGARITWEENINVHARPLYRRYQDGEFQFATEDISRDVSLRLIPSQSLRVSSQHEPSGNFTHLDVIDLSDRLPPGINFVGYDFRSGRLAFRGQMRHLRTVLDVAIGTEAGMNMAQVLKGPVAFRVPDRGLPYGLNYSDFTCHVTIVEYMQCPVEGEGKSRELRCEVALAST